VTRLRDRTEFLQELVDIGIALAGERDTAVLLELIVRHARRFTSAERGLLFIREADRFLPVVLQDDDHTTLDPQLIVQEAGEIAVDLPGTLFNTGSTLSVPLQERTGDVLGVLVLMNARDVDGRRIPFDVEYEALAPTLAAYAAAALHNAKVVGGVVRHADKLTALSRLTRLMTSAHEPQEVFLAVAEAATTLLGAAWTRVWTNDPTERVVRSQATFGVDRTIDELMTDPVIPYGRGLVGRIVEDRAPAYIADVARDSRLLNRRIVTAGGVHGFAGVPLIAGSRVVGVLAVLFRERRDFGPEDRQLMELLAGHAAIALENTRSYGEAQERLRTTETLLAVGQALSRAAPVQEMMRRVGRELARAIGADAVGAYFLDPSKEALLPVAGYRVPKALLPIFRRMKIRLDRWAGIRDAMRDHRAMSSSNAGNDPRCDGEALASVPSHSMLFAPTVARGETMGGIYVLWWQTGREFTRAEVQLIEGVAAQVGLALENIDLARQTEAKLKETNTLLAVSRAMSSTLDIDVLLRQFLGRIATVLDADGVGSYMLRDGEWLVPLQGYRLPPERLEILRELRLSVVNHAFYAEGARTKRPVFSPDAMNDPRIPDVMRKAVPHKSQLFVPIVAKGQVVGGLIAAWWDRVREFSESELALIEAIASQAGVALENARLFQENRRSVEELSVLHALSRAITGELDQKALIEALYTEVARVFDARNLVILLRGDTDSEVEIVLRIADSVREVEVPQRLTVSGAGLAGVVMTTGASLRTRDHAAECAHRGVEPLPGSPPPRHWLGVPMKAANDALGVIAMGSAGPAFTDSNERLLTNIAQLAALAIRSAQLFEERDTAYRQLAAAQDQLVRTEKLRALGEMASGVAHDFNNVLAAILGRAQLLMNNLRDPRLRQWAQIIDQAAQDGAQTVRRLQEFTRVRRDQPVVAVDLTEIVRGALDMTQSRWGDEPASRNITIELQTDLAPVPPIPGDPAELREALTNLILNAVDAMPSGGVLTLRTRVVGDFIELTISDTGSGIPTSVREKIFDPFFTTKGPRGTGLGLSMTYGIIVRHHGQIAVESEPGRGTTFRLTFPTRDVSDLPETEDVIAAPVFGAPLRCLVVDDEDEVASMLSDVLLSAGHTVEVFTDPAAAVAQAEAQHFDVLVTDLAMPGMAGWQVARAFKAAQPEIAVILMTGYGVELSPEEREVHSVDAVLTKPVGVNAILDAVVRVTTRQPEGERPADTPPPPTPRTRKAEP
jgi:GAF domain-containing protein/ActR/RegA family two-component response regulator